MTLRDAIAGVQASTTGSEVSRPCVDRFTPDSEQLGRYLRGDDDRAGIIGSASPPTATSGHQLDVAIAATTPKPAITDSAIQIIAWADPAREFSALVMGTMLRTSMRVAP